jgi:uncharacterized membrane protein YfcA
MVVGSGVRSRLSGPALRKVFATAMWLVGAWMLSQNFSALTMSFAQKSSPQQQTTTPRTK